MSSNNAFNHMYHLGLALLLLYVIYLLRVVLLPFALGGILAYALTPATQTLNRRGLSWKMSVLIIFLGLLLFFLLLFFLIIPETVSQFRTLADDLPDYTERIIGITQAIDERYPGLNISETVEDFLLDLSENLQAYLTTVLRNIVDLVTLVVTILFFGFILTPFILYYFLVDAVKIRRTLVGLFPRDKRRHYIAIVREIDRVLGGFIRGRLLLCLFVGVSVSVVLYLLGIEFPLVIGFFAGLADIVPYLGPVVGALPALVFAATKSLWIFVGVCLAFILINLAEGVVIVPRTMGKETGLHPLTVLFALMVGGQLYGALGLILAIPVAGVLKGYIQFYRKRPQGKPA